MEKEIKDLFEYMKQEKDKLQDLKNERVDLKNKKESFSKQESSFYKESESAYDEKKQEYDNHVKQVSDKVKAKKSRILEEYSKKMEKIDRINNILNKKYTELKSIREELEGKKAQLKWLEASLPTEGEANKNNRETLEKLKNNIENLEISVKTLETEAKANQEILAELVPENKEPSQFYIELQKESEMVDGLNFNNLDETEEFFKQSLTQKKPEDKKSEDKKPEYKKPEDKKPEETKPEDKKPEDKKPEETKPEDKKPEDKKPEETKPEDKKSEDKKPEYKKPEYKKLEYKKPEETKPEDKKPEDKKPEDKKPEMDKEKVSITLDAESGKVIFEKYFKDEAGETKHFTDKYSSIESIFNNRTKIMKSYRKYFKEHGQKNIAKLLRKLDKKLNPAVLKVLFENQEQELFSNYIVAVRDGDKDLLSFDYNINLENPYLIDKSYRNLNRQALIDNKNLGTEFNAVKHLRLKTLLSKLPRNARFVQKWIGKLPQPNRIVREEKMTDDQKKLLEEREKRDKYEEYMKAKYPSKDAGARTTSKGFKDAMKVQESLVNEIEAQKKAIDNKNNKKTTEHVK